MTSQCAWPACPSWLGVPIAHAVDNTTPGTARGQAQVRVQFARQNASSNANNSLDTLSSMTYHGWWLERFKYTLELDYNLVKGVSGRGAHIRKHREKMKAFHDVTGMVISTIPPSHFIMYAKPSREAVAKHFSTSKASKEEQGGKILQHQDIQRRYPH